MASGYNFINTTSGGTIKLYLNWSSIANQSNNTSTVTCYAYLKRTDSTCTYNVAQNSTITISSDHSGSYTTLASDNDIGYVTSNIASDSEALGNGGTPYRTNYYLGGVEAAGGGWDTTASGVTISSLGAISFVVAHDGDGTKSFNIKASFTAGSGTVSSFLSSGRTYTVTTSVTLDTIARGTTPILRINGSETSVGTLGNTITVDLSGRKNSSYTHDVYYTYPNTSSYLSAGTGVGTSVNIATGATGSWVGNITGSSTSGTMSIKVVTKNGTEVIQTIVVSMRMYIPTTAPSVSNVRVVDAATYNSSTYKDTFGLLVQSFSKPKVYMKVQANTVGATVTGVSVSIEGSTYAATSCSYVASGVTYNYVATATNAIKNGGSVSYSIAVSDSKGTSATLEGYTFSVLSYSAPRITGFSVERCNESGTPTPTGAYALLTMSAKYSSLNDLNTKPYQIVYGVSDSTSTSTISGNSFSSYITTNALLPIYNTTFDSGTNYTFTLKLYDSVTTVENATQVTTQLGQAAYALALHPDGGVAFGSTPTEGYFDMNELAPRVKDENGTLYEIAPTRILTSSTMIYNLPNGRYFTPSSSQGQVFYYSGTGMGDSFGFAFGGVLEVTGTPYVKGWTYQWASSSTGDSYLYVGKTTSSSGSYTSYQLSNLLTLNNTTPYTPTTSYHPATKSYVDSAITALSGTWADLTLASGISEFSSSFTCHPAYRIDGNHIYVKGAVCTSSGTLSSGTLATIPANIYPSESKYVVTVGYGTGVSSATTARIHLNTSGQIVLDWVMLPASNTMTSLSTTRWVDISFDYFIDSTTVYFVALKDSGGNTLYDSDGSALYVRANTNGAYTSAYTAAQISNMGGSIL